MRRVVVRGCVVVAAALLLISLQVPVPGLAAAVARHDVAIAQQIHDPEICWEPDIEFPVPCDDDDD